MKQIRGKRKTIKGYVVRDKMQKTVLVDVERKYRHPVYGKVVKAKKRYKVHDSENTAVKGDLVEMMETRKLSKNKRWRITRIIQKSAGAALTTDRESEGYPNIRKQEEQINVAGEQTEEQK